MKTLVCATIAALWMSGCSMSLPVRGQMQASAEILTGTATGYMDGGGTLRLVSSNGANCQGNFVYINRRQGNGVLTCADKRSGPFEFVSTGTRGTGHGTLSGERFIFTFGD